jgi:peptidoglycan/LPS O-acetylase OafA/YrhL
VHTVRYWPDLGVVCFLAISGFLVTHSAIGKRPCYQFVDFIIDRGSRIYSAFFPSLIFIVTCGLLLNLPGHIDAWRFLTNVLLLQNFPLPKSIPLHEWFEPIGTGRPLWTLSVEWWFYWGFGALYFFERSGRHRWLLLLVGAPGFIMLIVQSASWILAYPWVIGSFGAAYLATSPKPAILNGLLAAAALGLACTRYINHVDFYDLQGVLLASTFIVGAVLAAGRFGCPRFIAGPIAFLASYSFSLYLLNATVIAIMSKFDAVSIPLMIIACHTAAICNYALAERHYRTIATRIKRLLGRPL